MTNAFRRLDSVRRIQAVQSQKHRLEEWRLADVQRREAETRAAAEALIKALDGDNPLHGLFVAAGAKRLEALSAQGQRLAAERAAQAARALEQARRLKACEKLLAVAEAACEEERRRVELLDYLDGALGRDDASPA
jgi:regulator of protease activity HflC (stomatin/prohibitin superfamily)